jgi:hypothetical protein
MKNTWPTSILGHFHTKSVKNVFVSLNYFGSKMVAAHQTDDKVNLTKQ